MIPVRASSLHDLKTLILSFHPLVAMETMEEERAERLVLAACEELRLPLFEWTIVEGVRRYGEEHATIGQTTFAGNALRHIEMMQVEAVYLFRDFASHLEDPVVRRMLKEVAAKFRGSRSTLVMTGASIELPPELAHDVVFLKLELPSREELGAVVDAVAGSLSFRSGANVVLDARERQTMLHALAGMTLNQARQTIARAILEDGKLDAADIGEIYRRKAEALKDGGLLEFYAPGDNAHELGGFAGLKTWLDRAAMGFTVQAREMNLAPPKGILLVGVQGCGKSLAAKVIARRWGVPLLKLDAGRLYDKYLGETQKNFDRATALAKRMAPVVLWIDELEKAMATGGDAEADGGASKRLLGSFLTWLQEKDESVFVVGTVNRIDALPPELLRKGRFDEIFFVDLPTEDERARIFEIHLRLQNQDAARFDVGTLARASDGLSGAEIEQAVIGALYRSLHAGAAPDGTTVLRELGETVPLSRSRREDIAALREYARSRFVPVA